MITVNGLNAGPSMSRPTGWQKNSHRMTGGYDKTCFEEKLSQDEGARPSSDHHPFHLACFQAHKLSKSHIQIFLVSLCKKIAPDIGAARDMKRSPSLRKPANNPFGIFASQSAPHHLHVDLPDLPRHHAPVAFNSATGFSSLIPMADSRQHAAFFASVTYAIGASMISMVGRSGEGSRPAGIHRAGLLTPLRACHPRLAAGSRSNLTYGATIMASLALRVFRALLSRSPAVSIIRPAADLAEARRMAADLIAQDHRCSVRITAGSRGFDVEVAA
ncbi:hypothetical protein LH425_08365 [Laribacter hongkongensis]|nr:hypothetical protein [Laribacter hongkongensis]MCG9065055.1 hypothetical protein [Laribacter hongkongensis]